MPPVPPRGGQGPDSDTAAQRACVVLASMLAEPVLRTCSLAVTGEADGPRGRLVLAVTPTSVHVYALTTAGEIDAAHEIAVWKRAGLRVHPRCESTGDVLELTTAEGEHVELRAAGDAGTTAFVSLIARAVDL